MRCLQQICLVLCLGLTGISPAIAYSSGVVDLARAQWNEGAEAFAKGDLEGALAGFRSAYATLPDPQLAESLGIVECRLEHYADAARHLTIALEHLDLSEKQRRASHECLQTALEQVGELVVDGEAEGAEISVDGEVVGRLPLIPWSLDGGEHVLRVHQEGYSDATYKFQITPGTTLHLQVRRTARSPTKLRLRRPASSLLVSSAGQIALIAS